MAEPTTLILPIAVDRMRPTAADDARSLAVAQRLYRGAGELAGRIGTALGQAHQATAFLADLANLADLENLAGLADLRQPAGDSAIEPRQHPIDRFASAARLSSADIDLLLLAGLPDVHEGLSALLRDLNPAHEPSATTGLVAVLAETGQLPGMPAGPAGRSAARRLLERSSLVRIATVRIGAGAFWERGLALADGLWETLSGGAGWPCQARELRLPPVADSHEAIADPAQLAIILRAAHRGDPVVVQLRGDDPAGDACRVASRLADSGVAALALSVPVLDAVATAALWASATARGLSAVLAPEHLAATDWPQLPGPLVVATAASAPRLDLAVPVLVVDVAPPGPQARRDLWSRLAPDAAGAAALVPTSVGLIAAAALARDAAASAELGGRAVTAAELRAGAARLSDAASPSGGVRVRPSVGWSDLVLPPARTDQLREAVSRVRQADVVLERWGFLSGRAGRRGVRLLFCGPPGTGKTLAAEVLAAEVGRDLLVVDLSRTVSKWIGETEKNLAEAFDAAERGEYVLLFDEADALFARRTEVGDARDRYANLETAYLLSRLSWFDGVAVLATNLRQNLDVAFGRRLEFVIPFDHPDGDERRELWRRHLPAAAPLAADVELTQLADFYPITGALIRNAAVAAAYLAATDGVAITAGHLTRAVQREYAKAGLAFPGPTPVPTPAPAGGQPCP